MMFRSVASVAVMRSARASSVVGRGLSAVLKRDLASDSASTHIAPTPGNGRVVVVSSGKGGVGKTTTAASFAMGLADSGFKTVVIDFDIGLRNLDIHLGCERRVIFDFVNVLQKECTLSQALIKDKRSPNLSVLAASQTKDKNILTVEGVEELFIELRKNFDYIVCDSPAGIESGARHAMYLADEAIICTNPELSSCRDSDKMIGFIASRSRRAERGMFLFRAMAIALYCSVIVFLIS